MTARSAELPAPFFDFAMSVLFVFMALFVMSTMDTPKPAAGVLTPKAEFLVEMTWDDGSASDVDLYAKGPDGRVVFFGSRKTEVMFLDNDNTGTANGAIADRREIVTVRAIQPGRYLFGAHLYRKDQAHTGPVHIKTRVIKLNPYSIVSVSEIVMDAQGQELTVASFSVRADGTTEMLPGVKSKMVGN